MRRWAQTFLALGLSNWICFNLNKPNSFHCNSETFPILDQPTFNLHWANGSLCPSDNYSEFALDNTTLHWFASYLHVLQFEDVLNKPDPREDLRKLVDPRLEDNYPLDSVRKVNSFLTKRKKKIESFVLIILI